MSILYEETRTEQVSWFISNMIAYIFYSNKNNTDHKFSDLEFDKIMGMLRDTIRYTPDIGGRDCDILCSVLHTPLVEWEKYLEYDKSGRHARVTVKNNIDWHLKEGL